MKICDSHIGVCGLTHGVCGFTHGSLWPHTWGLWPHTWGLWPHTWGYVASHMGSVASHMDLWPVCGFIDQCLWSHTSDIHRHGLTGVHDHPCFTNTENILLKTYGEIPSIRSDLGPFTISIEILQKHQSYHNCRNHPTNLLQITPK